MTPAKCPSVSKLLIVITVLAILALPASAQTAVATVIQGTVVSASTGKPVLGAIVTATRNSLPPLSQNAVSAPTGAFQFTNLPVAAYRLCIQVPAGGYLNPCTWTPNPPTVTLVAGKSATGILLKITPGSILSVRIDDPSSLLTQIGKSGKVPPVSMGVRTATGLIEPLVMRRADVTGSEHEVTIPFDTAVPVFVHSAKLALAQSGGAAVPATGLSLPVTHPSATAVAAPQLAFQITSIKP